MTVHSRKIIASMLFIIAAATLLAIPSFTSAAEKPVPVPTELESWKPWVLYGQEESLCPTAFDGGHISGCAWPSRLWLEIETDKGRFEQNWRAFADTWAVLPGGPGAWPEKVLLDGNEVPVTNRKGVPAVRMPVGEHKVEGGFVWNEMPEMINVPPAAGLVYLTINGKAVDFPVMDQSGRLWVQKRVQADSVEDRMEVRVFRLIKDGIPMQVTNLLKINVSGKGREIRLNDFLLDGSIPMSLQSPLPARLEESGELKMQVRPGLWEIRIESRFAGPVAEIGPVKAAFGQETWAFQSANHLRIVKVTGENSIDPGQTDLPQEWKEFPAYLIDPETKLVFEQLKRGDPDPAPDRLTLHRTWWLDFDGQGFTVQDRIKGSMSRQWYLAMNKPGMLGRVSVGGRDQLITKHGPDGKPGVELRLGSLNMIADSRYEAGIKQIPAVGWDHDFQSVSANLNLPPGWRLLTATGVDVLPGTWFERWTLLDLFLVLIIALAVFKLFGWKWGLLALVTVGLCYHEPGAPRGVWLSLLAAMALLRVLPEHWFKKIIGLWRLISIVVLLVIAIPFLVNQVRVGFYPQLDRDWGYGLGLFYETATVGTTAQAPIMDLEEDGAIPVDSAPAKRKSISRKKESSLQQRVGDKTYAPQNQALIQDPNALNQTGPGLPTWDWRGINMRWNGPVDRDQEIHLYLLSPAVNSLLCFLRVVLLAILIVVLIDIRRWWKPGGQQVKTQATAAAAILLAVMLPSVAEAQNQQLVVPEPNVQQYSNAAPNQMNANEPNRLDSRKSPAVMGSYFPSPELLDELRNRLLEPPECMPYCADISFMDLRVTEESVTISLKVHAEAETAIPLPGGSRTWTPNRVLLNGPEDADSLTRDKNGTLWLLVPKGINRVILMGLTPPTQTFQLPLPQRPGRTEVSSQGWDISGVQPDGRVDSTIQLIRVKKEGSSEDEFLAGTELPPFLYIERTISLGLTWEVFTRVTRLTPAENPVVISVPLLEGESVTSSKVRVEKGKALLNLAPRATSVSWTSTLEITQEINLQAPDSSSWTEAWILDASPIWHCELSGIPVIHHKDGGQWRPQWRPWPGETVNIKVTRPKYVPGRTLTIDSANLDLTPGERFDKAALMLIVRASQGGQHKVTLPENAKLQVVKINGSVQPIGQTDREVVLPLQPGQQSLYLEWHQPSDSLTVLQGPEVNIGEEAVNANVTYNLSRKRWVLWASGPTLGPAVLFWIYLVVVVLAAVGLSFTKWTPLKLRHWILLGLGLTQVHPLMAIIIVGFVLTLGIRSQKTPTDNWFVFNAAQLGLVVWAVVAAIGLYIAIEKGLLGIPEMQISGNGSWDYQLHWMQDRIGALMPMPVVISLPKFVFHILMLVWALWLAVSLIRGLRWGWESFSFGGLWIKPEFKSKKKEAESAPDSTDDDFIIVAASPEPTSPESGDDSN